MKLTLKDISNISGTPLYTVRKWYQTMGLPGRREGKIVYVDSADWSRWSAAKLYRDSRGRMRKRNVLTLRRIEPTSEPDTTYAHLTIAELVAVTEKHPVMQARRFSRVSAYAARVERGEPLFS